MVAARRTEIVLVGATVSRRRSRIPTLGWRNPVIAARTAMRFALRLRAHRGAMIATGLRLGDHGGSGQQKHTRQCGADLFSIAHKQSSLPISRRAC
jgi:hypothetical protein